MFQIFQAEQNRTDSSNCWAAFWSVWKVGSDNLGLAPDLLKIYNLDRSFNQGCFTSKINFAKQIVWFRLIQPHSILQL